MLGLWDDLPVTSEKARQAETILGMLRVRPLSTSDLNDVSRKYLTRLHQLRCAGYRITCKRDKNGGDSTFYLHKTRFSSPQLEVRSCSMTDTQAEVALRVAKKPTTVIRSVLLKAGFDLTGVKGRDAFCWILFKHLAYRPLHKPMCDAGLAKHSWFLFDDES